MAVIWIVFILNFAKVIGGLFSREVFWNTRLISQTCLIMYSLSDLWNVAAQSIALLTFGVIEDTIFVDSFFDI